MITIESTLSYLRAQLSLIPIGPGSKTTPEKFTWKAYQKRQPTEAEVRGWLNRFPGCGIGIVCGKVSGGLEVLDLEAAAPLEEFRTLVEEAAPGLLQKLPRAETPGGGRHIYYRCEQIEGNQKLAQRAVEVIPEELHSKEGGELDQEAIKKLGLRKIDDQYYKVITLIETRGEGGQVLSPLCPPGVHPSGGIYRLLAGDLTSIPTITIEERKILLTAARACNEFLDPKQTKGQREATGEKVNGIRPGDDFNQRGDVCQLLESHGWKRVRSDSLGASARRNSLNGVACEEDEPDEKREGATAERQSKASLAIDIASDAELFHNAEGKSFATVRVGDHCETWPLKSPNFKRWIAAQFWKKHEASIHPPAIAEAILTLDGRASYEGAQREVYARIADNAGAIYLDLCDDAWRVVEMTSSNWRIIEASDCPVKFRRSSGMLPLPQPEPGGNMDELRSLLNLSKENQQQWILILSWLIASFRPNAPYPVLVIHGGQGSAKSTACRMLRALIDPNKAALRSAPKDERDLAISADNSHIIALDNLTRVPESLSDALCRISTGGGFATRELYSDNDEVIFDFKRPILLNGITEVVMKSDLLDRSILVYLPRILEERRLEEVVLWENFYKLRPRVLGALCDVVSKTLRNMPQVKLASPPRMADFARWAIAAEEPLGLSPGDFIKAYKGNRDEANNLALEASPLAVELREAFRNQAEWEGSSTALLRMLNLRIEARNENPKSKWAWPQSPKGLTDTLKVLQPNLLAIGLQVEAGRFRGRSLVKIGKTSAWSASFAKDQPSQEFSPCEYPVAHANEANPHANEQEASKGICMGSNNCEQKTFANDADHADVFPSFTNGTEREVIEI